MENKTHAGFDMSAIAVDDRESMAKMYEETLKDFEEGSIVRGTVLEVRPNEVLMDIGYKSEGAIPLNEFSDVPAVKPGDEFDVLLSEIENEDGMIALSKEKADQKLRWERLIEQYNEGSVVRTVPKKRVKGGLIVDIGGIGAFLPGSQIDNAPVRDMDVWIGREIEVKLIRISEERRNVIVSRRQLLEEQMEEKKKKLLDSIEEGQRRTGMVKNITDFGAFVDLDGLDGLLHITDMSWGRIKHPSEMLSVGQEVETVILDVDREKERVSLGLKQKTANPWEGIDQEFPVGSRLRGKVVNLAPYGAFVELKEGVEGLVHVSEISWTKRIARASDVLSAGEEVDVVVLSVDKEAQKIALGIRQTEDNPWDTVQERYPVGSKVKGEIRNFTSYGAFVELEDGIDGMIHVSDMSWTRKVGHPSEIGEKGQEIEAVVLEVDSGNRRISLGLKQAGEDPWDTINSRYRIGQLVKGKVTKTTAFGAFVEIEEGVDGLVHISEISDERVEKVKDVLNPGDEVEARVMRLDKEEKRISLSMKAAALPEEEIAKIYDESADALKRGDHMVDLAGAFDEAINQSDVRAEEEEWHPGEKDSGNGNTAEK
ncbi:MAG: 30S ribosomal protein S1 [Kiritimatiellia bacterium]